MKKYQALTLIVVLLGCSGRYVRVTDDTPFEVTDERFARGAYLVNQVTACGACHTTRDSGLITDPQSTESYLGGGNWIDDRTNRAKVWVPNITNDPETGLGNWTDDEIARAIRDGIDRDGEFISPWMPFAGYRHLSDEDVASIVVYLRAVPPVKQTRTPPGNNEFPWLTRVVLKLGYGRTAPARDVGPPDNRGRYLLEIGHCGECHSLGRNGYYGPDHPKFLAGSEVGYVFEGTGTVWAPNLTARGDEVKEALRTGLRIDGKKMAPPMSIFNTHYSGMTEEDLDAIVAFLKSMTPVDHTVPKRRLTPEAARIYDAPAH